MAQDWCHKYYEGYLFYKTIDAIRVLCIKIYYDVIVSVHPLMFMNHP